MNEHRELREQLGVYALGHGTADERAAVHAHLDGCAACRAELAALAPLRGRLADVDPDRLDEVPAPPPGLGDRVLAGIAAEQAAAPDRPGHRRWVPAVAAAASPRPRSGWAGWCGRYPTRSRWRRSPSRSPAPEVAATADVVPHTWGMEVQLHGEGFTAGEVYRVQVTEDGRRHGAGR